MGIDELIEVIEYTTNSKRKRHIFGGMLMSVSLLFGGLAFTTLTIREDDNDE